MDSIRRRGLGRGILTPFFYSLLLFAVTLVTAAPVHADNCLADVSSGADNCTSNDVRLANPRAKTPLPAGESCTSVPGDTVKFELLVDLEQSGQNKRYDVGVFIAEDGGDALTGTCDVNALPISADLDDGDSCGDTQTDEPQEVNVGLIEVPCLPSPGPDPKLIVNGCVSWQQNEDGNCLQAEQPNGVFAGAPSKCNCETFVITEISVPPAECVIGEGGCDDMNPCTDDACVADGTVQGGARCDFQADDTNTCGSDADTDCNNPNTCVAGFCEENVEPATTVCRSAAGGCDVAENCDGSNAECPGDVVEPATTECRASAGDCDVAENCTGTSAACPADGFVSSNTTCRDSAGECDIAENCTGDSATCPTDAKSTAECRASAGECDVPESCDGSANTCPADGFSSSAVICRAGAGICDVAESCSGSSATCPADSKSTAVCRASAGECDVPESCDGIANTCPANGFSSSAVICRAGAGVCDVAESCSGSSATCPADSKSTAVCRASAGECDVPESCDGIVNTCPTDGFSSSATVCRASAGECDVAENCTGSAAACPSNGFSPSSQQCRASAGVCDLAENCTGSAASCPGDVLASSATVCRSASGVCDLAENCTGSAVECPGDGVQDTDFTCRIAQGECDVAENCDGEGKECPRDALIPGCEPEVCRTAGFWSTHAGTEKKGKNTTQKVLDKADPGCPFICGEMIDDTKVLSADSVLEATCVSVSASPRLQLVRQLTAAALNCIASQGTADCFNVSVEPIFTACNDACEGGSVVANVDGANSVDCINALDCFNNGHAFDLESGECIIGTCGGDQTGNARPCSDNGDCTDLGTICVEPTDTCHDQPLGNDAQGNPIPDSSAGSVSACNTATGNLCTVVGSSGGAKKVTSEDKCTLENNETCNAPTYH